ncbi:cytochrome c biogenesis protein ResB [Brachybacterium huguangmaarense]|uniref:Cytochrome c biogenesis protein ResB n=1 Tax=Brachybacterium huguangmaarense TaxID=1652028 RepID=A0ABY6G1G8_9MICO|nr:cytochrome c biogenesis protein ResB [Brachybacterium huguangmaarense]UYG17039.1 cytochrome c biogenesis protein ResB [Brachybacterium huguangmaarense]
MARRTDDPTDMEDATTDTEPTPTPTTRGRAARAPRRRADTPRAALPRLGLRGTLLFLWRQLTSMQTALVLLMLLAIAAVPGSLYPQRSVNSTLTEQYLAENGRWARFLDTLGFFDVFSSPWFSAIYLLLFISLIGCVVPRLGVLVRQLRSRPPRTPLRLERFAGYTRVELEPERADEVQDRAERTLRRRRYRTLRAGEKRGGSIGAERGYLREAGNLLFHVALLGVLVGVAGGHLTQYRGQITVVEGEGFSNSLARYDSFQSGPWFDRSDLPDFQFTLDDFRASYDTNPSEHEFGQPRMFEADVAVTEPDEKPYTQTVRVNQPLQLPGASMYLLGNGYAPMVTITDPEGNVVAEGPVITIPRDSMYTSMMVLKAPDAEPEQIAAVGIFMPTAEIDESGPHSRFPDLIDPQLALSFYTGDLGLDGGVPKNAYEIDVSTLTPMTESDGDQVLLRMSPGDSAKLPDGSTVSFDGVKRYAAFDIKHDPFQTFTLVMALLAVLGLTLSLFVPRRRLWVRVTRPEDGPAVLEVAGLARSEDHQVDVAVADLVRRLGEDPDPSGGTPRE